MDIPPTSPTFHPFSRLPLELRLKIYDFAFLYLPASPRVIDLNFSTHSFPLPENEAQWPEHGNVFLYTHTPPRGIPSVPMLHVCNEMRQLALRQHGVFKATVSGYTALDENEHCHFSHHDMPNFGSKENISIFWTSSKDLVLFKAMALPWLQPSFAHSRKYLAYKELITTFRGIKYLAIDVHDFWFWRSSTIGGKVDFLDVEVLFLLTGPVTEYAGLYNQETDEGQRKHMFYKQARKWLRTPETREHGTALERWDVKRVCFVPTQDNSPRDALSLIAHWEYCGAGLGDLPVHLIVS